MGAGKKNPAGFSLVAHDEVEGKSEEGRALFRELCDEARQKGKTKELNEIHVGRVLDGQRRVTRDLLLKVMDISEVPNEQRAALWERYFGGAPTSIAEVVRRRIILAGSIRDYGKIVDLSHPSLCNILDNRAATAESLFKILTKDGTAGFPWKGEELTTKWRHEHEEYHMRKFSSNLLAARVETLFEMRQNASRIEWVERGNKPKSLENMSKNKIRILLSALRHGEPTDWESVDRVLFGMNNTLIERVEVAHAWLMATKNPPPPRVRRETKEPSDDDGDDKDRKRGPKLANEPIPQNEVPYPVELANRSSLLIIQKLLDELRQDETQASLVMEVSTTLDEVKAIQPKRVKKEKQNTAQKPREKRAAAPVKKQNAPRNEVTAETEAEELVSDVIDEEVAEDGVTDEVSDEPEEITEEVTEDVEENIEEDTAPEEYPLEDPETMLFGQQKEAVIRDEDDEEALPDFARYTSVWQLGEFLENFSGREAIGYATTEEAATIIATEIAKRTPFSINDTVNAMKVLAYCFGRFPDSEATMQLTNAIEHSVGTEGSTLGKKIMALLVAERRFSMFLTYYRDQHPDSAVTKLFASLTDLSAVQPHPEFDRFEQTDRDKSYDERINPKPKAKVDEKKKAKLGKFEEAKRANDALEAESIWEDD